MNEVFHMIGIYIIKNNINNKVYIGQSVDIKTRWRQHRCAKENYPLYNAFKKYGLNNFTFEVLLECSKEELLENEQKFILQYRSLESDYGYNQSFPTENNTGGHGTLFTYDQVLNIIDDLLNTNLNKDFLAEKYQCGERTIRDINCGRTWRQSEIEYPIRKLWEIGGKNYSTSTPEGQKFNTICPVCGGIKYSSASMCKTCSDKHQQHTDRPNRDTLLKEIANSSFVAVGTKYGVTDNAIRKWCKAYDLPTHTKEIKELYKKEQGILDTPKTQKDYTVGQFDLNGNLIATFQSPAVAAKSLGKSRGSHITEVCNGIHKTAYGYVWKYINQEKE